MKVLVGCCSLLVAAVCISMVCANQSKHDDEGIVSSRIIEEDDFDFVETNTGKAVDDPKHVIMNVGAVNGNQGVPMRKNLKNKKGNRAQIRQRMCIFRVFKIYLDRTCTISGDRRVCTYSSPVKGYNKTCYKIPRHCLRYPKSCHKERIIRIICRKDKKNRKCQRVISYRRRCKPRGCMERKLYPRNQ